MTDQSGPTGRESWGSRAGFLMAAAGMFGVQAGRGALGNIGILNLNWLDLVGHLVSDYTLPIGRLSMAVFIGWSWSSERSRATVAQGAPRFRLFRVWVGLLRWVVPLVVAQVLLLGILGEFAAAVAALALATGLLCRTGITSDHGD